MSPITDTKIEILSTNKSIPNNELDTFEHFILPNEGSLSSSTSSESSKAVPCVPSKPILITVNAEKNIENTNNINITSKSKDQPKCYKSIIEYIWDESLSTVPIFMKYFAFHECTILICGGLYHFQPDIGVICLSILPGISIIGVFLHFLLTQFKNINLNDKNKNIKKHDDERDEEAIKTKINSTYYSCKHYLVALIIFIIGLGSIYAIYKTNTYLSELVPIRYDQEEMSETMSFIGKILKFPHTHSWRRGNSDDMTRMKPFNYRISFVGSIIAPIIEESAKYLLVFLTFPIVFIWSFVNKKLKDKHGLIFMPTYSDYCIESLFVMFIAVCGGCGIAIMENLGYLAACQWTSTRQYCLPNKNFDILGAGLARGIFSVPFHCTTACIMADIVCMWMNTNIKCFNKNRLTLCLKYILSYPISIILPVFLHSGFNYWMKGIPFMTGCITIFGFSFLTMRISAKHAYINGIEDETNKTETKSIDSKDSKEIDSDKIDLTISEPFPGYSDIDEAVAL